MGRLLTIILTFAGFCLGAAVSFYNWTPVSFNYLVGEAEWPLIALLLGAFATGLGVMWLLTLARVWMLKRESRRLQNSLNLAETELRNLRNLPLSAENKLPASQAKNA